MKAFFEGVGSVLLAIFIFMMIGAVVLGTYFLSIAFAVVCGIFVISIVVHEYIVYKKESVDE